MMRIHLKAKARAQRHCEIYLEQGVADNKPWPRWSAGWNEQQIRGKSGRGTCCDTSAEQWSSLDRCDPTPGRSRSFSAFRWSDSAQHDWSQRRPAVGEPIGDRPQVSSRRSGGLDVWRRAPGWLYQKPPPKPVKSVVG